MIGNYIDMIDRVASSTGIKPKIALVTTATDNIDKTRCSDNMLKTTKAHLESLEVDYVIPISVGGAAESLQKIKNLSFETNNITRPPGFSNAGPVSGKSSWKK